MTGQTIYLAQEPASVFDTLASMPNMPHAACRDKLRLFDQATESMVAARKCQEICRSCVHVTECATWIQLTPRSQRAAGVVGGLIVSQVPDCTPKPEREVKRRPKPTPQPALRQRKKSTGRRRTAAAEVEARRTAVSARAAQMAQSAGSGQPGALISATVDRQQRKRQRQREIAAAEAKRQLRRQRQPGVSV